MGLCLPDIIWIMDKFYLYIIRIFEIYILENFQKRADPYLTLTNYLDLTIIHEAWADQLREGQTEIKRRQGRPGTESPQIEDNRNHMKRHISDSGIIDMLRKKKKKNML